MKKIITIIVIFLVFIGCNKDENEKLNKYFLAEIVSFDLNCSTCVVKFTNDSDVIEIEIGESENSFYQTINLDKDTFKVNQRILVKLRKAENEEIKNCITLYPSYNYSNIFIVDWKKEE